MKANQKLSDRQAYDAMFEFLNAYYGRTHSDGVGSLLEDLQLGNDNMPADPASWVDWQESVAKVLASGASDQAEK